MHIDKRYYTAINYFRDSDEFVSMGCWLYDTLFSKDLWKDTIPFDTEIDRLETEHY